MNIPADLLYSKSHEWVKLEETTATMGLTDYAQEKLGDLVFVNLPAVGDEVIAGEALGDVESVKAVSDVYCPVSGIVAAVNEDLLNAPQVINETPYEAWFIRVEGVSGQEDLLSAEEYEAFLTKLEEEEE
ncbi:Glycine cleavage system H protein [bioreactor metagenome]|uniref:Glycine cleavage system H protein n=1 Tax=bioreactor metagenome TaxID=1076179 RepID=A0A644VVB8_9ZZZZ